jgi:hypothetical protein
LKNLILFFLIVCFAGSKAQSLIFDQGNASLLQINPSYAGSNGGFRAQSSYRQEGQFNRLGNLALDAYVKPMNGGIFLSALHSEDFRKIFTSDVVNFGYAQRISILEDELKIIPSFELTWSHKEINSSFFVPISGSKANLKQEALFLTYGILLHYKSNYTVGMSIQNLHQAALGFLPNETKKPSKIISLNAAYTFHFSGKRLLQLMTTYSSQLSATDYSFQTNYVQNHLILGLAARKWGSYSAVFGYRGDLFVVQASYAWLSAFLLNPNARSFELHVSANIRDLAHRHVFTNIENW